MRSSVSSSARTTATTPSPARAARRDGFALTGPSRAIDPLRDAVRADLADVRLADRVFAPHYAAPLRRRVAVDVILRSGTAAHADDVASLARGDGFDLLDVTGNNAWGIAVADALVGYVRADALEAPPA